MSISKYATLSLVLIILSATVAVYGFAPPHPLCQGVPAGFEPNRPEIVYKSPAQRSRELPNNILVLRVDFPDQPFISAAQYPDFLVHDTAFFDRWMLHLADLYADASKGNYLLDWVVWPDVFTMSHPVGYYGADVEDGPIDNKVSEMLVELAAVADPEIDFSQYGGIIIFHSGAGQETHIDSNIPRTDSIWSTFVTRKDLQFDLDPENDEFQGIATNDGIFLKNMVLLPEWEFHDYFPQPPDPNASSYIFSLYGVMAHQFGHLLGLPTLFDNVSSNGESQGVGNWCLMGTGVWNANGYVPALPSAWNRYYMGWEEVETISESSTGLQIDHFLNQEPQHPTIYKIPISSQEYFLIENRQQNPDGSLDPYNGQPSYSFRLLPEGEQDYYEDAPLRPAFNFSENRYKGSEWDFMLPGLGGPLLPGETTVYDGSGLLIWHIDENIIEENFSPDFERNRPNGNAQHKGVDLEEADGIQNLDIATFDYYMYGGPNDAFRQSKNDYFGNALHNGLLSLPTAESYYGGVPLEIYDISPNGNTMSFSVNMDWKLDALYEGSNPYNAALVDLNQDNEQELVYVMPSGALYLWQDDILQTGYPINADSLAFNFCSDGASIYLPIQRQNLARLRKLDQDGIDLIFNRVGYEWASQLVDTGENLIVCMSPIDQDITEISLVDKTTYEVEPVVTLNHRLMLNPVYFDGDMIALSRSEVDGYFLHKIDLSTGLVDSSPLPIPADSVLVALLAAPLERAEDDYQVIVQGRKSLYSFSQPEPGLPLQQHFSYSHDEVCSSALSIADLDGNGSLDLILTHSNGVLVLDYAGAVMGQARLSSSGTQDFSGSSMVVDIDNDGELDIIGSFSLNRMAAWDSGFRLKSGFPVSLSSPSRNMPILGKMGTDISYAWLASDDGKVYRKALPSFNPAALDSIWSSELGGLSRTGVPSSRVLPNQYQTRSVFVPGELYIFPNPLRSINEQVIRLNVMTSEDILLDLKVYDISGAMVYSQRSMARAYLRNREIFELPVSNWSSGVYIAVISTGSESHRVRFAIEK